MKNKKNKYSKPCPLCQRLLIDDPNDHWGDFTHCNETVTLPNGRIKPHYSYNYNSREAIIFMLPFKIINRFKKSRILILNKKAKPTSSIQFKFLAEVPNIQFTSAEQLLNKLKLINILS